MNLSKYTPLCDAIVLLLEPLVEVAIHDLETETICYISGRLSKRKVGDPSLLIGDDLEHDLAAMTYSKLNFDQRLIKAISVPVDKKYLICINCDVSVFSQMQQLSSAFLSSSPMAMPESLFKNDWQEQLHHAIHLYLDEQGWRFALLTQKQKKELVYYLYQHHAFNEKKAADYIANVLGMGRATVFNYLKSWRQGA